MSSKFKFDLYPYTCRLVHGNYRIYDQNGKEIWKSTGRSETERLFFYNPEIFPRFSPL